MSNYNDLWYQSSDELRLYARNYSCTESSITSPATILCMHGLTRNSADFDNLAEHLSAPTLDEPASRQAIDNFLSGL